MEWTDGRFEPRRGAAGNWIPIVVTVTLVEEEGER